MADRAQKEAELLKALKECWYLPEEEISFWTENIRSLPDHSLDNVLAEVSRSNRIMSGSINAALGKNPNNTYLEEIKSKIKKIKKTAFEIEEGSPREKAEKELEQKLKEI